MGSCSQPQKCSIAIPPCTEAALYTCRLRRRASGTELQRGGCGVISGDGATDVGGACMSPFLDVCNSVGCCLCTFYIYFLCVYIFFLFSLLSLWAIWMRIRRGGSVGPPRQCHLARMGLRGTSPCQGCCSGGFTYGHEGGWGSPCSPPEPTQGPPAQTGADPTVTRPF